MPLPLLSPLSHSRPARNTTGKQGLISRMASCEWLANGKGIAELWTCQDVLLPMLPAQEILP